MLIILMDLELKTKGLRAIRNGHRICPHFVSGKLLLVFLLFTLGFLPPELAAQSTPPGLKHFLEWSRW